MTKSLSNFKPAKKHIFIILLLVIGLYVLIPQFGSFKQTPSLIADADLVYALFAVGFTLATYIAAAGTYKFLAFNKLRLATATLVQFGAMFINRLLPGGLGALGANYLYLRHTKHTDPQAASVVALNNFIGFVGNSLVISIAILFAPKNVLDEISGHSGSSSAVYSYFLIGSVVLMIILLVFGRKRFTKFMKNVWKQLLSYKHRPLVLLCALATSMLVTLFNVVALMFCLLALGVNIPFVVTAIILSIGVGAGAATPTPGGLGGFEAGLVAGFVAYDIDESTALAAALLYRFISYWIMLLIGALAFYEAQRSRLFSKL